MNDTTSNRPNFQNKKEGGKPAKGIYNLQEKRGEAFYANKNQEGNEQHAAISLQARAKEVFKVF